jgi:hypothetical protein
MTHHMERAV